MLSNAHQLAQLVALAALVVSCRSELVHDLEEGEANRVIAALAEQGIAAELTTEGGHGERSWIVSVPAGDLPQARQVLRERELPDRPEQGLAEVFDRSGLLPSPTEEQALLIRHGQDFNGPIVMLDSVEQVLRDVLYGLARVFEFVIHLFGRSAEVRALLTPEIEMSVVIDDLIARVAASQVAPQFSQHYMEQSLFKLRPKVV